MEDEKTIATGDERTVASPARKTRPAATPARTTPSVAKIRSLAENQERTVASASSPEATSVSPQPRNSPVLKRDGARTVSRRTDNLEKIGKYKIKKPLNEGGMGAVYLAVDPDLGENVVIKRLKASKKDSSAVERFKQEAKVLRELQSPRIANTFEFISEGRFFYFVQEYVEGCSVADLLEKQGTLSFPVAMKVFYEACSALKTVHSKKIVHRDIKPGNLLVSKSSMIKLTDFGIASNHSGSEKSESDTPSPASKKAENIDGELTVSGSMLGTPSYMSPEQFYDAKTVGPQADIYSLGVMLYEMLTGKKPFVSPLNGDGSIDESKMDIIKRGDYETPRKYNPKVPLRICLMIHKMLKYDPEKRYQSVVPLIKIAERYLAKYEIHDVNISIATIVANIGKNGTAPLKLQEIPEKEHKLRKFVLLGVLVALAVAEIVYAWKEGLVQRTLLRFIYTPVTVTLEVPSAEVEMRYSTGLPMKAFFFHEEGKQDEVKGMRREFKTAVSAESGNKVFTINPAVLTKGDYRVKVVFGSYVMWRSFRVGKDAVNIDENLQKEFRTVSISARSFDLYTGKDITAKTTFTVEYKGKWVTFDKVPAKEWKAGKVWKVRGTATDYKTVEYSMAIDWYQDDIRVTMGMDPE